MHALETVIIGAEERRAAIRPLLRRQEFALAGEIAEARALPLLAQLAPDVVIVDAANPAVNPLVAIPWLAAQPNAPQIIALGLSENETERRLMLELGAVACAVLSPADSLAQALAMVRRLAGLTGRPQRRAPLWKPRRDDRPRPICS